MVEIDTLIDREIKCSCGRLHYSPVKLIDIGLNAAKRLPDHIRKLGYKNVFIVADKNTWKAAGEKAFLQITKNGLPVNKIILEHEEVIPNETVIGEIITSVTIETDVIIATGSGTINDLCKLISYKMKVDYIIFASAPSMDGFVSTGSALMLHNVKTTIDCHGPVAVIGDTDILSAAPMNMIAAGMGDTLGKYTCLLDWKLSHIINGEYYCAEVAHIVEDALDIVIKQKKNVLQRDPDAINALTKALILTGIGMSFIGNSRPASGCEHHLSHYWEMKSIMNGKKPALHGAQVGVGMITSVRLYRKLLSEKPDFEQLKLREHNKAEWILKMNELYGSASRGIIDLEEKCCKNDIGLRNKRLDMIEKNWNLISEIIEKDLPLTEDLEDLLLSFNAPINPMQIEISCEEAKNAVIAAKEVRNRYTLLQLLWDLGLSEKFAEDTEKYFAHGQKRYFEKCLAKFPIS